MYNCFTTSFMASSNQPTTHPPNLCECYIASTKILNANRIGKQTKKIPKRNLPLTDRSSAIGKPKTILWLIRSYSYPSAYLPISFPFHWTTLSLTVSPLFLSLHLSSLLHSTHHLSVSTIVSIVERSKISRNARVLLLFDWGFCHWRRDVFALPPPSTPQCWIKDAMAFWPLFAAVGVLWISGVAWTSICVTIL